jgi:hypothetical protein
MIESIQGLQWDTIGSLPFQATLHAYYLNGKYATRPIVYRPGAVWIDVLGNGPTAAYWLDVENEDATPAMVPEWLDKRASVGPGGIYCSRANLAAVLSNAGSDRKYDLWLATLDGTIFPYEINSLPANANLVAVQAFPSSYLGINADLSVVFDSAYWSSHAAR